MVNVLFCSLLEGPCLLHTTTGNLLRTLRGPGECVRPRLLKLTRDGLVLVNYTDGTGHLAVFTINGRLLSDKRLDDQMLVCIVSHAGFLRQSKAEQFSHSFFACYATMWSKTSPFSMEHTWVLIFVSNYWLAYSGSTAIGIVYKCKF